jgi:GTP-dependent phosphoenolpyruvate carboxykinase
MFGTSPSYGDLNWDGIDFSEEQFKQITSIDKDAWREEAEAAHRAVRQAGLPPAAGTGGRLLISLER